MAQLNYNQQTNDTEEVFDIIPAGDYVAMIVASDYTVNKQNTGMLLSLTYEIIDGEFKGSRVFEYLSLEHEKEKTAIIAQKAFNSIKQAIGVIDVQDSAQLHGIPLKIDVRVRDAKDGYDAQNVIKKHMSIDGKQQQSFQTPKGSESTPQTGGKKRQPWEKP